MRKLLDILATVFEALALLSLMCILAVDSEQENAIIYTLVFIVLVFVFLLLAYVFDRFYLIKGYILASLVLFKYRHFRSTMDKNSKKIIQHVLSLNYHDYSNARYYMAHVYEMNQYRR